MNKVRKGNFCDEETHVYIHVTVDLSAFVTKCSFQYLIFQNIPQNTISYTLLKPTQTGNRNFPAEI
jgi:hypothetical protein